jgi:hypothetical protein
VQQLRAIVERLFAADESGSQPWQVVRIRRCLRAGVHVLSPVGIERRDKPVAASGDGRNGVPPEQLAQAAHLHLQVALLDHEPRPDGIEQLRLVDDALPPLDQCEQQIERSCAQCRRSPVHQQLPLRWPELAAAKTVLTEHHASFAGPLSTA